MIKFNTNDKHINIEHTLIGNDNGHEATFLFALRNSCAFKTVVLQSQNEIL